MTTAQPKYIDAATLSTWLINEEAVLIDIREPDEYAREHIPGVPADAPLGLQCD